jgi:DNA repair protein RadC
MKFITSHHTPLKQNKMKLPEIEINVKYKGTLKSELKQLKSSNDTYNILKLMYSENTFLWQEEMILICMNRANKVIGYYKVSRGGTTGTVADPKVIFTIALNCVGTCNIILSHNHPSGNLQPSGADREITNKIKEAGKMLDITLLDHLVTTDEGYYSFADEGLL